jgi:PAS domain S-box-containing protein
LDAAALARVLESSGDALVVLDSQWCYAYVNGPAETLIGKPHVELVGREVTQVFPEVMSTPFWEVYQRAAREQSLLTVEEFFEPLGRWFDVRAIPYGGFLFLHFRDVTAQKRAEERQRTQEERERVRLNSIFMQAPAFMAVVRGPHHVFEMVNPPYYQLVGHRDIIGRPVAEAIPEVVEQGFIGLLDQVYQTGEPFVGTDVPILLQRTPNGPLEQHFLDFTYQPLRDADGAVSGILAHGVDLTERKRLEQEREAALVAVRDSQERLELAFEAVHLGMWELDLRTGEQVWSGEQERLFGLKRGSFGGSVSSFLERVHPEDSKRVADHARRAFADPSTTEYENEFRVVRPDTGEVCWLYGRARIERNPATGEALRVTGVNLDISERKRVEEELRRSAQALRHSEERYRALVDASSQAVWTNSPRAGWRGSNPGGRTHGPKI